MQETTFFPPFARRVGQRCRPALLFTLAMGGLGCAPQFGSQTAIGKAGPAGNHGLQTSPFARMAHGRATGTSSVASSTDLDAYLKPEYLASNEARPTPDAEPAASEKLAALPSLAEPEEAAPTPVVIEDPAPIALADASSPPARQSSPDSERYSQRESRELMDYRGGDVIVISASTIIIVLLVVLLVVLLT